MIPEVVKRLQNAGVIGHIMQNAIKAKRLVGARKALRREGNIKIGTVTRHKLIKKGTYVSQISGTKEHIRKRSNFDSQLSVNSQLCNKLGHSASECRD